VELFLEVFLLTHQQVLFQERLQLPTQLPQLLLLQQTPQAQQVLKLLPSSLILHQIFIALRLQRLVQAEQLAEMAQISHKLEVQ
jgi:hypothetical protein